MKTASLYTFLGMTIALVPVAHADAYRTDLLGKNTVIQNSITGWNGEIAKVITAYEDGSVRIKLLSNNKTAHVPHHRVDLLLSIPTRCAETSGTQICENDKVYYPNSAITIGIPEGTVESVFTNGYALVRDGDLHKYRLTELGIEEKSHCSSMKDDICKNDRVRAEKAVGREQFQFEGKIVKLYTNGMALVENGPQWRQTVSVKDIVKKSDAQIETTAGRGLASVETYTDDDRLPAEDKPEMEYYLPIPGTMQFKGEKQ